MSAALDRRVWDQLFEESGLGQRELARLAGVSASFVHDVVGSKRRRPSPKLWQAIARTEPGRRELTTCETPGCRAIVRRGQPGIYVGPVRCDECQARLAERPEGGRHRSFTATHAMLREAVREDALGNPGALDLVAAALDDCLQLARLANSARASILGTSEWLEEIERDRRRAAASGTADTDTDTDTDTSFDPFVPSTPTETP